MFPHTSHSHLVGAAGAAPLVVSLPIPIVQGQFEGLLLLPPASLLTLSPSSCLLPGVGLLFEVSCGAGVGYEAGRGEAGEDAVSRLHRPTGALQMELVGSLVQAGVSPPRQFLDFGMRTLWFQVVVSNNDFILELLITLLSLYVQILVSKNIDFF